MGPTRAVMILALGAARCGDAGPEPVGRIAALRAHPGREEAPARLP